MSKIGNVNLALQEQANELGYSTVQEAMDNGYTPVYTATVADLMAAETDAHKEWEKEKEVVLGDLMNLMIHKAFDHDIIERAYNFIKKGEI